MPQIGNLERYPLSDNYDGATFLGTDPSRGQTTVNYSIETVMERIAESIQAAILLYNDDFNI